MKIPSLPTDNLYKFICLAGLSIFILSQIYYQLFSYQVILKNKDLQLEMALTKKRLEFLEKDSKLLENDKKKFEKSDSPERLKELENITNLSMQKLRDLEIDAIKMNRLAKEVFYLNDLHKLLQTLSIVGFVVGLFFFGAGLYLWYTRIQIYEDRIIRKKTEKQEIE